MQPELRRKVAVIGANGQVGAELCLMLAALDAFALVPVCRNRSGSGYLRWQGLACRHGRVADERDAPRLLNDCDVVINCSLASGTPVQMRRTEERITRNLFEHSKAGATIIHFSTQSVYGDPAPGRTVRWLNPYGRAKLATESCVRRAHSKTGKRAFILRLGHVCGTLQDISHTIRDEVRSGSVLLPADDRSSNTVFTAAIVGAVVQILESDVAPGTYDLMNTPRWTWSEVYEYEARCCAVPLNATLVKDPARPRVALAAASQLASRLAGNRWLREQGSKLYAHFPASANERAQAWWYARRARQEIAMLHSSPATAEHLWWTENGNRFFPASRSTEALLRELPGATLREPARNAWPDDLPTPSAPLSQKVLKPQR